MGLWEKHKEHEAARAAEAARQAAENDRQAREHQHQVFEWALQVAQAAAAGTLEAPGASVPLKKSEHALFVLDGAGLVEPRRGPGHWQGGNQGVSVHVPGTRSMRYRLGATRGTYAAGDEKPTIIDTGAFTITDQRALFVGTKQSREWLWTKLLGFSHGPDWVGIAVSNRQKVSGVSYDEANRVALNVYLEVAVAKAQGQLDKLVMELEAAATALTG
jgi:hypothetical protein